MLSALLKRLWRGPSAAELLDAGKRALEDEDAAGAARLLDAAVRAGPEDPEAYAQAALAQYKLGRGDAAGAYCEQALARDPKRKLAHDLLAAMSLPGPPYTEVLATLHRTLAPRTYVEIGIATGDSLAPVLPSTRVVAIDPLPRLTRPVGPNVHIYRMLSDDYFNKHDLHADLGGAPPDLAFIDGAHVFDQVLRDFINLERRATPLSTILLHDTYPLNRFTAQRTRQSPFWSGDVWRVVLILKKYRPDLVVWNVAAAPTGLCMVRGLDPASRVLAERFDAIVEEFMAVDYSVLDADKSALLNLVPNEMERTLRLAGAAPP